MRLSDEVADKLRTATVEVLLEIRRAYLQSPGANRMKNWDQLESRMDMALGTKTIGAWVTAMRDGLQIVSAASVEASRCFLDLAGEVHERDVFKAWKRMVKAERSWLIAKARLIAEQRKEAVNV